MQKIEKLESFKEVLRRQVPRIVGEPIPMKTYEIAHPKSCGNPWIGAYSKYGLWYKFYEGEQNDYDKIVALSFESDSYFMNYESFSVWKSISDGDFRFIVAKNLEGDVVGSVGLINHGTIVQLGLYYITEEYRHSGIGSKIFNEILKNMKGKTLIFHSMSHIATKCSRFGFNQECEQWKFFEYTVENGSGFENLLAIPSAEIKKLSELTESQLMELVEYDFNVCKIRRKEWIEKWLASVFSDTFVSFDGKGNINGYGNMREVAGGYVRRILVGPLYANNFQIASSILYKLLKKFYNIDKDFEWDPDIYAIYRRSAYFIVPLANNQMISLLEKLKGTGIIHKNRLFFQTRSTRELPTPEFEKIFAVSDLHLSYI